MNIIQMSMSAGVLILITVTIRALGLNKLPKITFLALWGVVTFRLLIPFSIPSNLSIYNITDGVGTFINPKAQMPSGTNPFADGSISTVDTRILPIQEGIFLASSIQIIWMIGAVSLALFFLVTFHKNNKELKTALPIRGNTIIDDWSRKHKLHRSIQVLVSDKISTPIVVGILKPRILLPKTMDVHDKRLMRYVLAHEYQHIKHFDMLWKLVLLLTLCLHWFNPLVWIMYVLANRDLEIACDEKVLTIFGEGKRSEYALALIQMAEKKSKFTPLYNGFNKNSTEERIISIMKFKKSSVFTIALVVLVVVGITTVFITSSNGSNIDNVASFIDNDVKEEVTDSFKRSHEKKDFAEFLDYDDTRNIYLFEGKWIHVLYDENNWDGESYSTYSRSEIVSDPDFWGEPVDLKTVRNPKTNKVEKLVEMTEEEAKEIISLLDLEN
ncbi:M56 family metallopeptidase [Solibacillus sp. FSL K6-1523]|uniref:M56 family metallopeptidase n=1 Tax=Solibacillus sp. FSL K6-1523 TaxID=2921471 RepID=UPI0030F8603D